MQPTKEKEHPPLVLLLLVLHPYKKTSKETAKESSKCKEVLTANLEEDSARYCGDFKQKVKIDGAKDKGIASTEDNDLFIPLWQLKKNQYALIWLRGVTALTSKSTTEKKKI